MNNKLVQSAKWCIGVGALSLASLANANLLSNGNFETGEAGWNFGPVNAVVDPDFAVSDSLTGGRTQAGSALFQPNQDAVSGVISRSIDLVSGATYLLEFYLKGAPSLLSFKFGGVAFDNLFDPFSEEELVDPTDPTNSAKTGWTYYSAAVNNGGTGTLLEFTFSGSVGDQAWLDDVSLDCSSDACRSNTGGGNVPEPGSLMLVGAALAGLGIVRRRKKA